MNQVRGRREPVGSIVLAWVVRTCGSDPPPLPPAAAQRQQWCVRKPWDRKLACYDWHHKGMGGLYSEKTGVGYSSWQPSCPSQRTFACTAQRRGWPWPEKVPRNFYDSMTGEPFPVRLPKSLSRHPSPNTVFTPPKQGVNTQDPISLACLTYWEHNWEVPCS